MLQASALDVEKIILVKPIDASKQNKYKCPDCNEEAIFCKGKKFLHIFDTNLAWNAIDILANHMNIWRQKHY